MGHRNKNMVLKIELVFDCPYDQKDKIREMVENIGLNIKSNLDLPDDLICSNSSSIVQELDAL